MQEFSGTDKRAPAIGRALRRGCGCGIKRPRRPGIVVESTALAMPLTARRRSRRLSTLISTAVLDCLLVPLVAVAALLLKSVRRMGLMRLKLCRHTLVAIGVLPVRHHYYEPFTTARDLRRPLEENRLLPGIDWNLAGQLALLERLRYGHELADIAEPPREPATFNLYNGQFGSGDAEFLYQLIRARKPRNVFEIGSGNSTLMALRALRRNREEGAPQARHLCIEPYEAPWLERTGVTVLRQRLEAVDRTLFGELDADDLLFIDSSHVIRPQGDVLTEYLEILPTLRPGVIVHVHDIFTPRDYPRAWVLETMRLWNEQYLLEAFLTENRAWQILAALNLLKHRHYDALKRVCPFLTPEREPGSFYLQKLG